MVKQVSADSSQNKTASASESPSQGKIAEQSASEDGEQKPPIASDGMVKQVSADSSQNKTASASESPSQGKNVTQNLSREIQMNIDKLSQGNDDDDEFNHESHKEDDNQESDTESKTDLDDLHKLRSFLHKELK